MRQSSRASSFGKMTDSTDGNEIFTLQLCTCNVLDLLQYIPWLLVVVVVEDGDGGAGFGHRGVGRCGRWMWVAHRGEGSGRLAGQQELIRRAFIEWQLVVLRGSGDGGRAEKRRRLANCTGASVLLPH